jgi:hypothetical protein
MQMDLMEQSIRMLYKRQGCMRLQFTAPDKKGNVQQYFVPEDTDMGEIPTVDLSDKTREEAEAIMQEWAYHTFDGNDIPMCEFKLMHLPDGYHGIFLHMDHRLIDSSGLYVIIADLYGIYAHLALGKPMPKDPADFEQLLVKELALKFSRPTHRVKTVYDCVSCAVAVVMSFAFFGLWRFEGVKLGTVICALVNGFLIGRCTGWMDGHLDFRDGLPWRKYFS